MGPDACQYRDGRRSQHRGTRRVDRKNRRLYRRNQVGHQQTGWHAAEADGQFTAPEIGVQPWDRAGKRDYKRLPEVS